MLISPPTSCGITLYTVSILASNLDHSIFELVIHLAASSPQIHNAWVLGSIASRNVMGIPCVIVFPNSSLMWRSHNFRITIQISCRECVSSRSVVIVN